MVDLGIFLKPSSLLMGWWGVGGVNEKDNYDNISKSLTGKYLRARDAQHVREAFIFCFYREERPSRNVYAVNRPKGYFEKNVMCPDLVSV